MGDRGRQLLKEESAKLKEKAMAALDGLLQIATERVLDFIAPGAEPAQASASFPYHSIKAYECLYMQHKRHASAKVPTVEKKEVV